MGRISNNIVQSHRTYLACNNYWHFTSDWLTFNFVLPACIVHMYFSYVVVWDPQKNSDQINAHNLNNDPCARIFTDEVLDLLSIYSMH
jgi:hypothetical protein